MNSQGLAIALTLLVTGCASLHSNQGAMQVYTLDGVTPDGTRVAAASSAPEARASGQPTLLVLRPLAVPGLDTDRIALLRGDQRLDYYAASRWPAPLPDVLQSLLIAALRDSGNYRAVQSDLGAFAADEMLQLEIRRCQAEYGSELTVRVELMATLGLRSDRAWVASVSASSAVAAGENRMRSVMAAYSRAVAQALEQIVTRLASTRPVTR